MEKLWEQDLGRHYTEDRFRTWIQWRLEQDYWLFEVIRDGLMYNRVDWYVAGSPWPRHEQWQDPATPLPAMVRTGRRVVLAERIPLLLEGLRTDPRSFLTRELL